MGVLYDFIFDNAYAQDAREVEAAVRDKYPHLLHKDESIVLAFRDRGGKGRDKEYFTSHRILIKDGKGVGNKRKNYQSIPYKYIQAFSVETAGKFDGDVTVQIFSSGIPKVSIDFSRANADIYQIQQFLSAQVASAKSAGKQSDIDLAPSHIDKKQTTAGNIIDWFGDNAKQVSTEEVERVFKNEMPVLLEHEMVQAAFKSGRDYTVMTDKRYMTVDVQGVFGKKIEFMTVLWSAIQSYSIQTAGAFLDRDMEMTLYTDILSMEKIKQDFRTGKCDIYMIQQILNNHILGEDTDPLPETTTTEGIVDQKGFWWFRDNQRPLDAKELDRQYHTSPKLLRASEHVEMAFKGWRDMTIFTNLRVIIVDPKGMVGKQIEYLSLPWKSIVGHAVRTAGKYVDFDTEVCFWTEKGFIPGRPGRGEDDPPVEPEPWVSYFELDFNKSKVDMTKLNYYLSKRLLHLSKMDPGAPIPMDQMTEAYETSNFEQFLQWIGGDQRELDPKKIDHELHTKTKILLDEEKVLMAFKAGRDTSLFTNLRVLLLDVQGLINKKVEYQSIPYKSIYAWSVETAGMWDRDTELNLYTRNRWFGMAKVEMDFRTGRCDIAQINKLLSALIIGLPSDSKIDFGKKDYSSGNQEANPIKASSFGMLGNSWEIDASEIETKLRTDPKLLLDEEKVLKAFQSGRDVDVYTNRRVIQIDTKGLTGKRVKYKSIPFKHIHGYEFETAGHLDRDAEIYLYTDITDVKQERFPRIADSLVTKQSLLVKKIDIYEIGAIFTDHLLFGEGGAKVEEYAEEPEIDLSAAIY